jgi:hypothetical protein
VPAESQIGPEGTPNITTARGPLPSRAGRRAPGDPRSRPAERCRVLYGYEPESALGKPRSLLFRIKRDIAPEAPATCAMQTARVERSVWSGLGGVTA